jgi:hypothetical protein
MPTPTNPNASKMTISGPWTAHSIKRRTMI